MKNFTSDYLDIHYHDDINTVHLEWKTTPDSNEFKAGLNKGLELVKEKKAPNWIGDVRQMGAITEEDQQWSNEDWFPRALHAGLKNMAVLVSDDIFNQMAVDEIMKKVPETELTQQYFDDIKKAKNWLKEHS